MYIILSMVPVHVSVYIFYDNIHNDLISSKILKSGNRRCTTVY